jgi:hypothetical protein
LIAVNLRHDLAFEPGGTGATIPSTDVTMLDTGGAFMWRTIAPKR